MNAEILTNDNSLHFRLDDLTREEKTTFEGDLGLASQMQRAWLPHKTFNIPGWQSHFRYLPAGLVGGDFCDLFEFDHGLFFLIGDVSGKGLGASVLTTHLHATFRGLADAGLELQLMVEAANRVFCQSTLAEHFATLIVGRAAHDGSVEFVNAGHMPLLRICADLVHVEGSTGFPLGMFADARFPSHHMFLDPGDSLLMFDGVTEARNAADEEYGIDRLKYVAARNCAARMHPLDAYLEDMRVFSGGIKRADDVALLSILRRP
jgi:sigma-B regulation protein RsbU (phosphoserine phosphatase)